MSNTTIQIDLLFQTNAQQIANNLQSLSNLLQQISTKTTIGLNDGDVQKAVQSAQQLQVHLQKAINQNTGKIDLSKLNSSLKSAGTNLQTLTANLSGAGPAGQQAFLKVATAIASAETPMISINDKLKDFMNTMANTVKWQIASTAIHGIQGMLNSAVGHAKNLDKALNDIRIVTGYSSDYMKNFAQQASEAAKALGTTTTEYAEAALIFYQQGLSGDEVEERANTVIKLSQVTGQSAQQVSDQMTAIWNNFDDGSASLEYYADVLAKLGAATAASTDEISAGLEKFAAVADTVGLSYEYAAASVATVVDKTRQSAEVVGTSFKTIFARMQGVSLGETLEDGVDLNKYSKALEKVGVEVLNSKGEMREMDDILKDLGSKWDSFGESTQIAIAQTVGGIRQYNQMISLMDNWDSVLENIELAKNATGELAEQQEIWSDSYAAAAKKVEQSKNELYEKFISDKSLIGLTDVFAELIDGVSNFIDSMGGIGPLILTIVGIFSKQLFPILQAGFNNLKNNISVLTGKAAKDIAKVQSEMSSQLTDMLNKGGYTDGQRQQLELVQNLLNKKRELEKSTKNLSVAEREEVALRLQNYEALTSEAQKSLERKVELEQEIKLIKEKMNLSSSKKDFAEAAAVSKYRNSKVAEEDWEEVDSVVEDATTTTKTNTQKEIQEIEDEEKKRSTRREEINKEISGAKQAINSHFQDTDKTDPNHKTEEYRLEQIELREQQIAQLEEEQKQLDEIETQEKERKKHLEEVLSLQEKISEEKGKKISDITAGEFVSKDLGGDLENNEALSYEKSIGEKASGALSGGQFDQESGNISMDVSIGNFEKLLTLMVEYQNHLSTLTAIEDEYESHKKTQSSISQEVANAETEVSAAQEKRSNILKKIDQLENSEGNNLKEIKSLHKELAKAEKEVVQAEQKKEKALKDGEKSTQKYISTLLKDKDALKQTAKEMGLTEKQIEELDKAFDELEKNKTKGNLEAVIQKIKDMKLAAADGVKGFSLMSDGMANSLVDLGMSKEQLNSLIDKFRELGIISPEIANKMRLVGESGKNLDPVPSKATLVTNALQGIAKAAGSVSMAVGAVSQLKSAFEEGTTSMEKTMAIASSISMIIPVLSSAFSALTLVRKVLRKEEELGYQVYLKSLAGKLTGLASETGATWLNTAAKIANLLASPWTMAFAVAAVAAIAIAVGAIMLHTKKTEEDTQAQLEQQQAQADTAAKSAECAEAWVDQMNTMDSLIAKYKQLKDAQADTTQATQDIIDQVPDMIDAYDSMAQGLELSSSELEKYNELVKKMDNAAAAGDVEAVEAARQELDSFFAPKVQENVSAGADAAAKTVGVNLNKNGVANGRLTGESFEADFVARENQNSVSTDILRKNNLLTTYGHYNDDGTFTATGERVSVQTGSPEELVKDIEAMQAAKAEMEKVMSASDLANDAFYQQITEILESSQSDYEQAKNLVEQNKKYTMANIGVEMQNDENVMGANEVTTYEDYEKYKGAFEKRAAAEGMEQEDIDNYFNENQELGDFVQIEKKLEHLKEQTGNDYTDYVSKLTKEGQEAFLNADIKDVKSKDDLKEAVEDADIKLQTGLDPEIFDAYVKEVMKTNEALKDNEELAKKVAKAQIKFEKAIKDTQKILEDNEEALDKSQEGTTEYYEACGKLATGLNEVFGGDAFDAEIVAENLDDVKLALEGNADAYDRLQSVAANNILKEQLESIPSALQNTIDAISSIEGVNVGDLITIENPVYDQLKTMYDQAYFAAIEGGKTTAEAMAYANSLMEAVGFEAPEMEAKEVEITGDIPDGWVPQKDGSVITTDASGNKVTVQGVKATPIEGGKYTYTQTMLVPKKKGAGFTKTSETIKPSGNSNKGGGGGGSKPKNTSESRGKKTDIVDRYKEINDQLEETTRLMNKNSILAEGLWGPARLKKLKENIKLMEQENKQLKAKYELTKQYLKEDADALLAAGKDAGINFAIDSGTGLITNYTDVMTQLFNEREALLNSFGETMDEAEEERLEEFDKKVDAIKESYEQYETTLDEKKDAEEEHLQKVLDTQTAYYNLLNEELEIKLTINDKDLQLLEYYFDKISDDFYDMTEAAEILIGDLVNGSFGGKVTEYVDKIKDYQSYTNELERKHNTIDPVTGEPYINDQQYIEGLDRVRGDVMEILSSLYGDHKTMLDYYSEALSRAGEELAKYTGHFEHLNSTLEHYHNLMSLIGKEKNYEAIGKIIEGQIAVSENQMAVARQAYEMYQAQQTDIAEKWQAAVESGNTKAAEQFEKQYLEVTEKLEEAHDDLMAKTEASVEAYRAKLENNLAQIRDSFEKSLTGGKGFEWVNTTMERLNSLQEEYLTTTNKIYETNKMMNSMQQQIDKTTNSVAKRKLKDFMEQTKNLQNQTALSKFELDIQQAKYDLLLAEIALEEAQNAKSQVRLQRDSEGNFGYVYTADSSAVDDAQQKFEDAQNNLYNVSLEGANKYVEQRNQLTQEFYDTMSELEQKWLDGSFTSEEEYRAAQEEAQTFYYEKLRQASELYNIAIGADASAAAEHILGEENLVYKESFSTFANIAGEWKRKNKEMELDSEGWKITVQEYVTNVIASFDEWSKTCARIEKESHLDNLAKEVEKIVENSDKLTEVITKEGGVLDSIESELKGVNDLTSAYAERIKTMENLMKIIEKYYKILGDNQNKVIKSENEPPQETPEQKTDNQEPEKEPVTEKLLKVGGKVRVKTTATSWERGGGNIWNPVKGNDFEVLKIDGDHILIGNPSGPNYKASGTTGWIHKKHLEGFDTGGYTGDWDGSYGKLAMLHKKELILNEGDTKNFLASLEILERIVDTIDLQAANSQYFGKMISPSIGLQKNENLEQSVYIEASFPNATDKNEIQEAFKDIVNLASQYANRK